MTSPDLDPTAQPAPCRERVASRIYTTGRWFSGEIATDFSTYSGTRVRPFALPLALAGAGCHHGSRRCLLCHVLAGAYAASMRWAAGFSFDPDTFDDLAEADQTLLRFEQMELSL